MAKKTMRSKKRVNKKSKRGGFFFTKKVLPEVCSNTNLDDLNTSTELHQKYQACCPKNFLGFKNRSTMCRNIDNKFQQVIKQENDAGDYDGDDEVPQPQLPAYVNPQPKPWYKFWGGKKSKHNKSKSKKNKTKKHRGKKHH
jgi:hypothetical protein